jgi:hypothetical protein
MAAVEDACGLGAGCKRPREPAAASADEAADAGDCDAAVGGGKRARAAEVRAHSATPPTPALRSDASAACAPPARRRRRPAATTASSRTRTRTTCVPPPGACATLRRALTCGPSQEGAPLPAAAQPELLSPGTTIHVADVQDVILHALLDAPAPKWLTLQARRAAAAPSASAARAPARCPDRRRARAGAGAARGVPHAGRAGLGQLPAARGAAAVPARALPPARARLRHQPEHHQRCAAARRMLRLHATRADRVPRARAVQSVMAFMMCQRQQLASQPGRGAQRADPTKRQSTAAVQRARARAAACALRRCAAWLAR